MPLLPMIIQRSFSDIVTHVPVMLRANPARVVIRPFMPADDPPAFRIPDCSRAQRVANRVLALDDENLRHEWQRVSDGLANRHRDIETVLSRRFHEINGLVIDPRSVSATQALLIGGNFSEEYSFEAAALFNPSIVAHPDQSGVPTGAIRFILSLRGVGEGHISSVTFRTGPWAVDGTISVDEPSAGAISPRVERIPARRMTRACGYSARPSAIFPKW